MKRHRVQLCPHCGEYFRPDGELSPKEHDVADLLLRLPYRDRTDLAILRELVEYSERHDGVSPNRALLAEAAHLDKATVSRRVAGLVATGLLVAIASRTKGNNYYMAEATWEAPRVRQSFAPARLDREGNSAGKGEIRNGSRQKIYDGICRFKAAHGGVPPTWREAGAFVGLAGGGGSMSHHIAILREAGLIKSARTTGQRVWMVTGATWTPPLWYVQIEGLYRDEPGLFDGVEKRH